MGRLFEDIERFVCDEDTSIARQAFVAVFAAIVVAWVGSHVWEIWADGQTCFRPRFRKSPTCFVLSSAPWLTGSFAVFCTVATLYFAFVMIANAMAVWLRARRWWRR